MKQKLSIGVCVLISLALVSFGLLYGTVSGFAQDRAYVTALLTEENGLLSVLTYRGADGLNLCVVARRHLDGDADVAALETAAKNLRGGKGGLSGQKSEDARLSAAAERVASMLNNTQSFQESTRDKAYLDMLLTDMEQLSQSGVIQAYNSAATAFNEQLEAPFSGSIARTLGVKPCELYQ